MSEITKVYLYSKMLLVPQQEEMCLKDISAQAAQGFRIELQREVFAHTAEETFVFLVKRIEPPNKFYGLVDGDTMFEIMHDEPKKAIPICASPEKSPNALEEIEKLGKELFPETTEVGRLKPFIDELEALRNRYSISWECLHKIVEAIEEFGNETAPSL